MTRGLRVSPSIYDDKPISSNPVEFMKKRSKSITDSIKNMTINGECSGCGTCCDDTLPLTYQEIRVLKKWVKDHHYTPATPTYLNFPTGHPVKNRLCPFRNQKDHKCDVYDIRPLICRHYKCDNIALPLTDQEIQICKKVKYAENVHAVSVREEVFGER